MQSRKVPWRPGFGEHERGKHFIPTAEARSFAIDHHAQGLVAGGGEALVGIPVHQLRKAFVERLLRGATGVAFRIRAHGIREFAEFGAFGAAGTLGGLRNQIGANQ